MNRGSQSTKRRNSIDNAVWILGRLAECRKTCGQGGKRTQICGMGYSTLQMALWQGSLACRKNEERLFRRAGIRLLTRTIGRPSHDGKDELDGAAWPDNPASLYGDSIEKVRGIERSDRGGLPRVPPSLTGQCGPEEGPRPRDHAPPWPFRSPAGVPMDAPCL